MKQLWHEFYPRQLGEENQFCAFCRGGPGTRDLAKWRLVVIDIPFGFGDGRDHIYLHRVCVDDYVPLIVRRRLVG